METSPVRVEFSKGLQQFLVVSNEPGRQNPFYVDDAETTAFYAHAYRQDGVETRLRLEQSFEASAVTGKPAFSFSSKLDEAEHANVF